MLLQTARVSTVLSKHDGTQKVFITDLCRRTRGRGEEMSVTKISVNIETSRCHNPLFYTIFESANTDLIPKIKKLKQVYLFKMEKNLHLTRFEHMITS